MALSGGVAWEQAANHLGRHGDVSGGGEQDQFRVIPRRSTAEGEDSGTRFTEDLGGT